MNVLVVDDSAVIREAMQMILARHRDISVAVAADPIIAMQKMRKQRPDVIVLDLEMPRMDGIEFLRLIMRDDPIPVVVCSALAGQGTETALRALEEGAVDVITKPRLGVRSFVEDTGASIVETIRAASKARARARLPRSPLVPLRRLESVTSRASLPITTDKVVVIGASTGGTEALRLILEELPVDVPGLVIVQHMPEVFTAAFARRLNETCALEVKEAASGDRITPGRALIAPGNRHTRLLRSGGHYITEVFDGPQISRHRPSVDVLFSSAATNAGRNAIGIILTGMGDDGADGMLALRNAGAITIAQDEASSVVFGMPKEAIARGAVDEILPLGAIAKRLAG